MHAAQSLPPDAAPSTPNALTDAREERLRLEGEAHALEAYVEIEAKLGQSQQDWFYQEGAPFLRELLYHPDLPNRARAGIERLLEEFQ